MSKSFWPRLMRPKVAKTETRAEVKFRDLSAFDRLPETTPPRCLEGIRSFLSRNQGHSYLLGDCSRQQAAAQQSHRLEQLPNS